jgi:hypothetical protein
MMALSEQDKEWVKLISEKLTYEVTERVLSKHVEDCPYGQRQINYKHLIIGIIIGAGLLGGGSGLMILKSLLGI